jgi:hypothetical protein
LRSTWQAEIEAARTNASQKDHSFSTIVCRTPAPRCTIRVAGGRGRVQGLGLGNRNTYRAARTQRRPQTTQHHGRLAHSIVTVICWMSASTEAPDEVSGKNPRRMWRTPVLNDMAAAEVLRRDGERVAGLAIISSRREQQASQSIILARGQRVSLRARCAPRGG